MSAAITVSVSELFEIFGEILDEETLRDIHAECRGVRASCFEQLSMITGITPPDARKAPTEEERDDHGEVNGRPFKSAESSSSGQHIKAPEPQQQQTKSSPVAPPTVVAKGISIEETLSVYGEGIDADTIKSIHSECRGVRSEVCEQLTMLTGINPSGKGEEGGSMSREVTGMSGGTGSGLLLNDDAYEDAVATGEEKAKLDREKELNGLMKRKVEDVAKLFEEDRKFDAEVKQQRAAGPQSLRGITFEQIVSGAGATAHSRRCFERMIAREKEHCGEFVCFYHSYSLASILYEVNSCIARLVYGLAHDFAPSARLLKQPFKDRPHLKLLLEQFSSMSGQDHNPNFRAVAICASVSLHSPSSEAPPARTFQQGYSLNHGDFTPLLDGILKSIGCEDTTLATSVRKQIVKAADEHTLHGNLYGGSSGMPQYPGQMLQIFVRADCVDDVAYGSQPMGVYRNDFNPPSDYLRRKNAPDGQARVFWHPSLFFDQTKVKVYHYAANEGYDQKGREQLQRKLVNALKPILGTPEGMLKAYYSLEGLPAPTTSKKSWF